MYRTIYELLEKTGKVKSAAILTGKQAGCRCIYTEERGIWTEEGCLEKQETGISFAEPYHSGADWTPYEEMIAKAEETGVIRTDGEEILIEIFQKNPRMIILGGGHVSCPTAHLGKMLGFHVTVMDDRAELLTQERFPDADELILGSFEELSKKIPPYGNAYYVIVTRGHKGDSLCASQILKRPYVYLGMIGSRTKVRLTKEKLMKEGFTKEQLDTIHAPIGLPIGGQLPEEIAVSIAAEIVQVKNRHYTAFTDDKIGKEVLAGKHGVMVTIVKKAGSSPRGTGSKMFLEEDGTLYGSIGGGSVEYEAMKYAEKVEFSEIQEYNLSVSDDKNLGMICGGKVEVLFERI